MNCKNTSCLNEGMNEWMNGECVDSEISVELENWTVGCFLAWKSCLEELAFSLGLKAHLKWEMQNCNTCIIFLVHSLLMRTKNFLFRRFERVVDDYTMLKTSWEWYVP